MSSSASPTRRRAGAPGRHRPDRARTASRGEHGRVASRAAGRRPARGHALRHGGIRAESRDPAGASSPHSHRSSRPRPTANDSPTSRRGRGTPPKRHDQDGRAPRREPRSPLAVDRDPRRRRGASQHVAGRYRKRTEPRCSRPRSSRPSGSTGSSTTCSICRVSRRAPRRPATRALGGRRAARAGAGSARLGRKPHRALAPRRDPARRGRREADRARARQPARERAQVLAGGHEGLRARDSDAPRSDRAHRRSGPGVPPGELETIFEPFRRGADPLQSRGTGLGLAIARGFAEANGGRVWAESRPGQGATFALALDAATVPARAGA